MMGIRFDRRTLRELVAASIEAIDERRQPLVLACANPHSLVIAQRDAEFRGALNGSGAVIADGVGCVWAARLFGYSIGPRITGSDYFVALMSVLNERRGRVYFFGSREAVLRSLRERVRRDFPYVVIESFDPPFGDWSEEQNDAMLRRIRLFEPDVLWVGMTAPKQEKWVTRYASALSAIPVIGCIGAVFDYYAGHVRRAPPWVCRLGLEWLYRLPREPRRLWRRTVISAPRFMWAVMRERLTG